MAESAESVSLLTVVVPPCCALTNSPVSKALVTSTPSKVSVREFVMSFVVSWVVDRE